MTLVAIDGRGGLSGHTLLTVGDTTAHLDDWAQAMGLRVRVLVERLRAGWQLLDALQAPRCARSPWHGRPYAADPDCQRFVAAHPGGATLGEIGEHLGVTRERVRQMETAALQSLRRAMDREGMTMGDLASVLGASTWERIMMEAS